MKRALRWVAAAAFMPALFWVGGYNFDERGFAAAMLLVLSVATVGLAWVISEDI